MDRLESMKSLAFAFSLGAFVALITKMHFYKENLDKVKRKENGKIDWALEAFINSVEVIVGGLVGLAAYVGMEHLELFAGSDLRFFVVGAVATASGKIFELIQKKVYEKTANKLDEL